MLIHLEVNCSVCALRNFQIQGSKNYEGCILSIFHGPIICLDLTLSGLASTTTTTMYALKESLVTDKIKDTATSSVAPDYINSIK